MDGKGKTTVTECGRPARTVVCGLLQGKTAQNLSLILDQTWQDLDFHRKSIDFPERMLGPIGSTKGAFSRIIGTNFNPLFSVCVVRSAAILPISIEILHGFAIISTYAGIFHPIR